uniref:F-box domain-containing protein n=1 Tax=Rhabditophanes sp. KR3021 TaxID=114890 RepID=A0AC35U2K0_9BILA
MPSTENEQVPVELLCGIFKYIDSSDINNVAKTCKHFTHALKLGSKNLPLSRVSAVYIFPGRPIGFIPEHPLKNKFSLSYWMTSRYTFTKNNQIEFLKKTTLVNDKKLVIGNITDPNMIDAIKSYILKNKDIRISFFCSINFDYFFDVCSSQYRISSLSFQYDITRDIQIVINMLTDIRIKDVLIFVGIRNSSFISIEENIQQNEILEEMKRQLDSIIDVQIQIEPKIAASISLSNILIPKLHQDYHIHRLPWENLSFRVILMCDFVAIYCASSCIFSAEPQRLFVAVLNLIFVILSIPCLLPLCFFRLENMSITF